MKKLHTLSSLLLIIVFSFELVAQENFLLNYQDVEIAKVTQDISKFSKKTLILDPRVKGRISIFSGMGRLPENHTSPWFCSSI